MNTYVHAVAVPLVAFSLSFSRGGCVVVAWLLYGHGIIWYGGAFDVCL